MKVEALPALPGKHNLHNYDEVSSQFDWSNVEKEFSWYETGKVNMAYEAIDRHTETYRKNKDTTRKSSGGVHYFALARLKGFDCIFFR